MAEISQEQLEILAKGCAAQELNGDLAFNIDFDEDNKGLYYGYFGERDSDIGVIEYETIKQLVKEGFLFDFKFSGGEIVGYGLDFEGMKSFVMKKLEELKHGAPFEAPTLRMV